MSAVEPDVTTPVRLRVGVATGLTVLALLLVATMMVATGIGPLRLPPGVVAAILWHSIDPSLAVDAQAAAVVTAIRLPRIILAGLVGALLGLGGALMQGLYRNPMADPGLVGVSAGAALFAVGAIALAQGPARPLYDLLGSETVPLAAFVGGLAATALVWRIASRDGETSIAALLLAGIAVTAIAMAGVGFFIFLSDERQIRDINFWLLGSLAGASWRGVHTILPFAGCAITLGLLLARPLNALMLGEREAGHLGYDAQLVKRLAAIAVTLGTGAAVSLSGTIGFVGLVVPHIMRLALGADHRWVIPASTLGGATLLIAADAFARTLAAPAELPIGLLTSTLGAPFFLWLLRRRRDELA